MARRTEEAAKSDDRNMVIVGEGKLGEDALNLRSFAIVQLKLGRSRRQLCDKICDGYICRGNCTRRDVEIVQIEGIQNSKKMVWP